MVNPADTNSHSPVVHQWAFFFLVGGLGVEGRGKGRADCVFSFSLLMNRQLCPRTLLRGYQAP